MASSRTGKHTVSLAYILLFFSTGKNTSEDLVEDTAKQLCCWGWLEGMARYVCLLGGPAEGVNLCQGNFVPFWTEKSPYFYVWHIEAIIRQKYPW